MNIANVYYNILSAPYTHPLFSSLSLGINPQGHSFHIFPVLLFGMNLLYPSLAKKSPECNEKKYMKEMKINYPT